MKPTNVVDPNYFHKVVDCQWACPAHTPVPEYIRLIAQEKYTEAYMLNSDSNVFPGVLGRTCDRPCEPACRRVRTEETPVAICRLKRVAADNKGDITAFLPKVPTQKNGKKVALIGAGPASLAVARDLLPFGYEVHLFDRDEKGGGMMRSQIPAFRLPEEVLDEEVDRILDMGVNTHFGQDITSMKSLLDENDIFISESDTGIYDALNKGVTLASGEVIAFLHSDDIYFNNQVLLDVVEVFADKSIDVVYGDVSFFHSKNTSKIIRKYKSDDLSRINLAWGIKFR